MKFVRNWTHFFELCSPQFCLPTSICLSRTCEWNTFIQISITARTFSNLRALGIRSVAQPSMKLSGSFRNVDLVDTWVRYAVCCWQSRALEATPQLCLGKWNTFSTAYQLEAWLPDKRCTFLFCNARTNRSSLATSHPVRSLWNIASETRGCYSLYYTCEKQARNRRSPGRWFKRYCVLISDILLWLFFQNFFPNPAGRNNR